ncbi:hypothetical protein CK203_071738 [Vitis vinifera]|uniref:Uncharacterized protein n=1 Tax=Vitis vinifera TaxID=29760 RepID=A0A438C3E2_VITVI|nr:hypothetical protein CK203_071738 [Vitis vinifera]
MSERLKGKRVGESAKGAQTSLPGSDSVVKVWPSCWKGLRPAFVSRGVVGGWKLLAGKLRSLGFSLTQRGEESKASGGKEYSIVEVETSSSVEIRNAVWLEIEKKVIVSNEEVLKGSLDKEFRMVWVRILGIPLHLWGKSLFKSLGEACGCFVAVDEDTSEHRFLQWARILVKVRGWNFSSSLQVVVGSTSYAIHLWWETLPWKSEVQPLQRCKGRGGGDEVVDGSHTPQRVAKVLSVKGTSLVSLDDLLFSAKGEKGTIPDVMEAVVGAETSLPPASDGLELSGGGSSELGQPAFLLGPEKDRCHSSSSTALASFEGPDPCASTPMVLVAILKPLADDALLEEVLRFQGSVLVKVRGDSLEMASPNTLEKGVEAMKGPLSMVFPDDLEVVFPENVYLGEGLLF